MKEGSKIQLIDYINENPNLLLGFSVVTLFSILIGGLIYLLYISEKQRNKD